MNRLAAPVLLFLFLLQGAYLIQRTSPTTDEVAFHMVNGYAYLKTHDYRMSPANPPLLREWMALPWLAMKPALDLEKTSWKEADSVPFAQEVFYKDNRRIADRLLYSSRFMILLLGAALGWLIYSWASALYGARGGFFSLALYAFTPSFLAHSSIAHTDIGVTFFTTLSAWFTWRYLEKGNSAELWRLAIAFGLACASKYNALYFGPIFLAVLLVRKGPRASFRAALLMCTVSFLTIWTCYFFETKPLLAGAVPRVEEKIVYIRDISKTLFPKNTKAQEFLEARAHDLPIPAPSFFLGVAGIVRSHRSPYLHYAPSGWTTDTQWYSYLLSFSLKMTLPFLCVLFLRVLFFKRFSADTNGEMVLLVPALALFAATCFDSTAVGVRYLFPALALLFVWVGGVGKAVNAWPWLLVALNLLSGAWQFPNHLSYVNELGGGPQNAYRLIRGSDIDWGQGLKGLKKYMEANKLDKVALEYFGTADPSFYGIPYEEWKDEERLMPEKKVYAISLYYLEHAKWASSLKPTAMVDGSLFIYDLR